MSASLDLNYQLNQERLPVTGQPRLVYLLLEARLEQQQQTTSPLNLSLVVDASHSMFIRLVSPEQFDELAAMGLLQEVMTDGVPSWQTQNIPPEVLRRFPRKIDYVLEALRAALEQLRPEDRFSLVAFAGRARTLLPLTTGRDKRKLLKAISDLEQIDLGDDTLMAQGIGQGWQEMERGSDPGRVNRLLVLTDGFTRDTEACWGWLQRARQAGVAISTMGAGSEFNDELLIPMSEQTGGNAYLVFDFDELPEMFRNELAAAQAVVQRNVEMKLLLTPGVELRQAYRVRPAIAYQDPGPNRAGSYNFFLGDLNPAEPPAVLLELIVPPRPAGRFRIVQAVLTSDAVGGGRQMARQDVVVELAAEPGQLNGRVMNIVERVSAFKLHHNAMQDVQAGQLGSATRKLQAAATRLLDMGEAELAQLIQDQAQTLAQGQSPDSDAAKKARYGTRKLTQKLD
jgi:Ca-activated chloride channel family protein